MAVIVMSHLRVRCARTPDVNAHADNSPRTTGRFLSTGEYAGGVGVEKVTDFSGGATSRGRTRVFDLDSLTMLIAAATDGHLLEIGVAARARSERQVADAIIAAPWFSTRHIQDGVTIE
jgi:hypothetical protein